MFWLEATNSQGTAISETIVLMPSDNYAAAESVAIGEDPTLYYYVDDSATQSFSVGEDMRVLEELKLRMRKRGTVPDLRITLSYTAGRILIQEMLSGAEIDNALNGNWLSIETDAGFAVEAGETFELELSLLGEYDSENYVSWSYEKSSTSDAASSYTMEIIGTKNAGPNTVIDTAEKTLEAASSTYSITVTSDGPWSVVENIDWVNIGPTSGSGNETVTVMVDTNNTGSERSGSILVNESIHSITQSAGPFAGTITPLQASFAAEGGNESVELITAHPWTASSDSWITITGAASGRGNATVNYTVAQNTTTIARTGTISIESLQHTVQQSGSSPSKFQLEETQDFVDIYLPVGGAAVEIDLSEYFTIDGVTEQIVQMDFDQGTINIEMLPAAAPLNVANFLSYVDDDSYNNTIIHRSIEGFVIQGGSFTATLPLVPVPTRDPVVNEFSLSNLRGTVSMAKLADQPDSATSGFFISLADNSAILDPQNGGFTVFARVIGSGMYVADVIEDIPTWTLTLDNSGFPFADFPMLGGVDDDVEVDFMVELVEVKRVSMHPQVGGDDSMISFTVGSSSSSIVEASLNESILTLEPNNSLLGTSTISVTAFDTHGNFVEKTFIAQVPFTLTVTASPLSSGTVSESGDGSYGKDITATLTATPSLGYLFGSWGGGASGSTNPLELVMDTDKSVTAFFLQDTSDTDDDGLSRYDELVIHGTNPEKKDTDEDGIEDKDEIDTGLDPLVDNTPFLEFLMDNPSLIGLFASQEAIYFSFGQNLIELDKDSLTLDWSLMRTDDLSIWEEIGKVEVDVPKQEAPYFFRFELNQ